MIQTFDCFVSPWLDELNIFDILILSYLSRNTNQQVYIYARVVEPRKTIQQKKRAWWINDYISIPSYFVVVGDGLPSPINHAYIYIYIYIILTLVIRDDFKGTNRV
jgi:hypothetical protein